MTSVQMQMWRLCAQRERPVPSSDPEAVGAGRRSKVTAQATGYSGRRRRLFVRAAIREGVSASRATLVWAVPCCSELRGRSAEVCSPVRNSTQTGESCCRAGRLLLPVRSDCVVCVLRFCKKVKLHCTF